MSDIQMSERLIPVNGADLWVAKQGRGVPVMLSNGGPGCCDYLGPVAAMIDDLAQVYRWEQRGCGRSLPTPPYDLDTCLTDLDGLRRTLGHDRWIIGGHSWGANLSLAYALAYPQQTRAVLYLSGNGFQNDRDWHAVYSKGRDEGRELLPDFDYPPNLDVNREVNDTWKMFIKEPYLWRQLAALDLPVLAICGSEDIRPNWPVQQLVNLMPNARFELVEGAGHHIELTRPDELRDLLRGFLQGLPSEPLPRPLSALSAERGA